MLETVRRKLSKEPEYINPFAEFIRNASARERKKVFEHVMREATKDQQKLMERAKKERERSTQTQSGAVSRDGS